MRKIHIKRDCLTIFYRSLHEAYAKSIFEQKRCDPLSSLDFSCKTAFALSQFSKGVREAHSLRF